MVQKVTVKHILNNIMMPIPLSIDLGFLLASSYNITTKKAFQPNPFFSSAVQTTLLIPAMS